MTIQRGLFGTVRDASIRQSSPSSNDGAGATLTTAAGLGGTYASVLWFDVSFIPHASQVLTATLTVDQLSKLLSSTIGIHEILSPWSEATVTWNSLNQGWVSSRATSFTASSGSGARTVNVAALVQGWVNGAPNNGILIEESGLNQTQFQSSEYSVLAKRPKLDVCYQY